MKYNPEIHHRRSIRLKDYDYSQEGAYFLTICTHNRQCLFGEVVDGEMILNDYGIIIVKYWLEIPNHFPNVELDEFIVMPNHVHGIVVINETMMGIGTKNFSPSCIPVKAWCLRTVGSIVRGFKIGVTKWFRRNTYIHTVWQRNYYEHIIRNGTDLHNIRAYIINNPVNWGIDENYIS